MQAIRVTIMVCVTSLVVLVGVLVYLNHQDRYLLLPQDKSMFVFDKKNALVNYCNTDKCQLVMPNGYNENNPMNVMMAPNGGFMVQPMNMNNGGFMMPGPQMNMGMMHPPVVSSLQTRPVGMNPAMNMVPAGMNPQQMMMVPSPMVPMSMNGAAPAQAGGNQPEPQASTTAQPATAPQAGAPADENGDGIPDA